MITVTALLFWLLTDDAFRVTEANVTFRGLQHADEAEVRAHLSDLERAPNVFRVRASDIVRDLSILTEVDAAHASVTLPASVSVELDEREPLFIWSNGDVSWLVDTNGMLFSPADDVLVGADAVAGADAANEAADAGSTRDGAPGETATDPGSVARAALPVVRDARIVPVPPTEGSYLSAMDLEVMRQLLAVTPEMLGSKSTDLRLSVDQNDGYVLESRDLGWDAVFGPYTPSLQPSTVVPSQVQCLRWTLAARESRLDRVRLALSDDYCGTFTERDKKAGKQAQKQG